jgi:oligopeptide/dipeptide ABC transporter ATP-binding protein
MVRLQKKLHFSYIVISHDLGIIRYISHRVAVMYLGEIIELAPVKILYDRPLHPYTRSLLSAVPIPNPRRRKKRIILRGDVPSPIHPPPGCRFHPRCPERMDICDKQKPETRQIENDHLVTCHLWQEGQKWSNPAPG